MRIFKVSLIENASDTEIAAQVVEFDVELDEKRSYSIRIQQVLFQEDGN